MTSVDPHQEAHLRRLADLRARLQGISDRQIKALRQWCQLCLAEQQQRYLPGVNYVGGSRQLHRRV